MTLNTLSKLFRNLGDSRCSSAVLLCALALLFSASPALANQQAPSPGGSVLNILFLGLIAYFLVRTFRRRRDKDDDNTRPGNWTEKNSNQDEGRVIRPMDRHEAARQMWGHLSSDQQAPAAEESSQVAAGGDFNESEFLEGAKLFFSRFQQASDSREFDDLKVFLSEEVYEDAVAEARINPAPTTTEIMLLNARLMEVKSEDGRTRATVFYDAQIRKGEAGEQPVHVRVVWEFSRDDMVENGLWTLEKINKVDQ